MKEFCNTLKLYLTKDIASIHDNHVTLKPDRVAYEFRTEDFTITPKEEKSDAGSLYSVEQEIVIDKASASDSSIFSIIRSSVVELAIEPGHSPVLIGSLDYPARVSITTNINKDKLIIRSKMRRSPL